MTTRGIRNHNPGNLRYNRYTRNWLGCTGQDEGGYAVFDSDAHGLLAIVKQLRIDKWSHGLNTIRGVITRWAPSSENDTNAYITAVTTRIQRPPDAVIDLDNPKVLRPLVKAIIWQENGSQPYSESLFDQVL